MLLQVPKREEDMINGKKLAALLAKLSLEEREKIIYKEIIKGNIPNALRKFTKIRVVGKDANGIHHKLIIWVLSDYLSIGSDKNFLRIPMTPHTAQSIANHFDCLLPTKKTVDEIWKSGKVKLQPQPIDVNVYNITSPKVFYLHQQLIEMQRKGKLLGMLTVGHKKDIVITNRLINHPDRVAIYGWHYLDGKPIQPLSIIHSSRYYDYSHGIRLIRNIVQIDGYHMKLEKMLRNKNLSYLLSDEGPISFLRYPT